MISIAQLENVINNFKMCIIVFKMLLPLFLFWQDFQDRTTILEKEVHSRGHLCIFLPKFHCELNPIEHVWCQCKKHTRSYANGTITRLRKIVPESFSLVTCESIGRFFAKCRDYEQAYDEGHTCDSVDEVIKKYKSHRRVKGVT